MDDLLEIYGGEVPEDVAELHSEVTEFFHKKANGPLDLQVSCLVSVLATKLLPPPTKPTKKTEKVTA